ncbi:MAG: hypothetical protein OES09_00425 [Gammaproteobacteria bacterium]|nr:hypothetical protein [Gammaproteobacteria bacterium]
MIWVDLLIDPDSVNTALDLLGRLQVIELQQYDRSEVPFEVKGDQSHLEVLAELEHELKRLADCLPVADSSVVTPSRRDLCTDAVLPELQARLRAWAAQAHPLARKLRETGTRMEELELLALGLPALGHEEIDVALLADDGHKVFPPFLVLADATDLEVLDSRAPLIVRAYPLERSEAGKGQQVLLVGVTDADATEELERQFHARGMRFVRVPNGLHGFSAEALQQVQGMQKRQQQVFQRLESELADLNRRTGVAGDLWLLRRHLWVNEALVSSLVGERFVWLGGWVPAARYDELLATLDDSGVPFLIHQERATVHGEPPVQLANPAWIRRFEIFVKSFGIPAADDVDPSPILAVMTPLMFGYMFGDVGHGAVLMVVGWLGRRRLPVLTLLIPAGLVGVLFGFLYGSVFCNEQLLPALWLRPLEEPLWILGLPIVFGWLVVLVSMLLAGLQAHWQRRALHWWTMEAPLVLLYIAVALAVIWLRAGVVVAAVALFCLFGAAAVYAYRRSGWSGIVPALLAEMLVLLETVFQLLVNTISFARLGAFALAHAGLSAAVIAVAAMPASVIAAIVILVLGNGVVIALEGLVVSIQTTRLVMFEFFRRFMAGEGRPFRPLSLPNQT